MGYATITLKYIVHKKLTITIAYPAPLNRGDILKIVIHPVLANCPSDISIKNNGIPQRNNINKYGIKKAPGTKIISLRAHKKRIYFLGNKEHLRCNMVMRNERRFIF